jgi:hypothetical protein
MDISISICPTELEVGSEGHMYDEGALLDAIREFIEAKLGKAANITCLQVGFRQGDQWARIDGDAFAGQELLSEFFGLYGTNEEMFVPTPEPIDVELALANETIRHCGVEEFTGLEHSAMEAACQAYRSAVIESLADDPRAARLNVVTPKGKRILHSQWCGAHFSWTRGAMGVMSGTLTEDEKAALDAADDAGLAAAKAEVDAEEAAAAE